MKAEKPKFPYLERLRKFRREKDKQATCEHPSGWVEWHEGQIYLVCEECLTPKKKLTLARYVRWAVRNPRPAAKLTPLLAKFFFALFVHLAWIKTMRMFGQ